MKILHRAVKWFGSQGIAKKILIVLLVVSIIPILCIQFISFKISTSTIKAQTGELILANLEQSANSVESFLETYDKLIMNIYTDSDYVTYLKPINTWDSGEFYAAKHELVNRLQNISYVNPDILGIAIVGVYGDTVFYDSVTSSGNENFCFDDDKMRYSPLFQESMEKKHTIYSKTYHKMDSEYGEKYYLYIAHQLTDFNSYGEGPIGSIMICVDETAFGEVYAQGNHSESNVTFVVNRDGDIISYPDKSYVGTNIFEDGKDEENIGQAAKEYIQKMKYKSKKKLEVNYKSIRDGEFYIINVQDLNYTLSNVWYISVLIILIGLLVGILCMLIAISFSDMTDKSVKKILHGMNKVYKGNLDVRIEMEGNDEFAQISDHFNDMIQKIKKSNAMEREAIVREKNAEIKSLEAQINPHFLYNTLDTINWMAIAHEEFTISRMLTSLAVILRYSVHKSNEIVKLSSELEYLKKYVYLQQQRFDYSFQCILHVEEEVLDCKIHKLLIQPLIENTIVHGFPGNTGFDEINLRIHRIDDTNIEIVVEDNGKGMDPELAEFFNQFDYSKERIESSIGVRNVITRVKLYYGESGHFHVVSSENGTAVTITIPYE